MLAAVARNAAQPVPAPSAEWARLEAENVRLTEALNRLTAATNVKRW